MAETFAETPPATKDSTDGSEALDTFNDTTPIELPETPQSETPLKETHLQEEEVKDEKTPQKQEAKETGKADEGRAEEAKEEAPSPERKAGNVKGVVDGKIVNLDPDMAVRVKIDGKYQNVPLTELRDGFSSSAHVSDRLENLQERERTLQHEMDEYVSERDEIKHHLGNIRQKLDDPDSNPMDALYYLLDMTGRNRNDYYKRILGHHLEEVETLQMMDEPERRAYFLERENEYLKERNESSTSEVQQAQEEKAFVDNLNSMREARNVSEEEFVDAYQQLLDLGEDQSHLTPEVVMDYACIYPAVEAAEDMVEQFDPELVEDDEVIEEVAEALMDDPQITVDEVIAELTAIFGAPTATRQVNKKLGTESYYKPNKKAKGENDEKPETFDDLNFYNYQG